MNVFKNVRLNNIIYYKEAEFDLDYQGITYIVGDNKNAALKGRMNGAGKTLLASSIIGILYPDVISAKDLGVNKSKHELLAKTGARLEWDVELGGVPYKVAKFKSGKSAKWSILKLDDKGNEVEDINPRQITTIAESFLRSALPLSSEDFFSTVYLSSHRMDVLQAGTPTNRHHYFTNLFRLHDFERVKGYFQTELKELADAKIKRDTYIEALTPVSWVRDYDYSGNKKKLSKLEAKLEKVRKSIRKVQRIQKMWELHLKYRDDYKVSLKYVEGRIEKIRQALTEWHRYEAQLGQINEYKKALGKYSADVIKASKWINVNGNIEKEWKKFCKKQDNIMRDYESALREWKRADAQYREDVESVKEYEAIEKELKKIGKVKDAEEIATRLEELDEQLDHLENHEGTHCDVCGSLLTGDIKKTLIKKIKSDIKKLEGQLEKAKAANKLKRQLDKMRKPKPVKPGAKPEKPEVVRVELDLRKPKKPSIMDKPSSSIEELEKQLSRLRIIEKAHDRCEGIDEDVLKGVGLRECESEIEDFQDEIISVSNKISQIKSELKKYREDNHYYTDIKAKISKIGTDLEDWPIFEALIEAYGNKGIKIFVMQNICGIIVANLNKFSHLLFPEPMEFSADIGINTFNLTVKRKDGTESDVRNLSGAESISFSLLWLISVLPLIPESRRCNFVILDDYEAGVDEPTRRLLREEFLPQLQTVVPHVIFITPYNVNKYQGNRVFCCVKKGTTTKLVKL